MQPRAEALVGLGTLAVLVMMAGALGQRDNRAGSEDPRASSYLAGPAGARALAEALGRLGIAVDRHRRTLRQLPLESAGGARTALLVLDPMHPIRGADVGEVLGWSEAAGGGDLILAGDGARWLIRCFGYAVDWRGFDSVPLTGAGWQPVSAVLAATSDRIVTDSSRLADAGISTCEVPPVSRVDTLLTTISGRVAALRLTREDTGGEVVLLSDAGPLRNRALRDTEAGPFALGLLAGRYQRALFEESTQGFGEGGSLGRALGEWSTRSPFGWGLWQLVVVGLLALGAGAVRFGPPRLLPGRRRRSPLEHVRALATALAAARGHDVAIGLLIEGLRRRLVPAGQRPRGDRDAWLAQLAGNVRSARARHAVHTLQSLNRPGQRAEQVRRAANAVEDVWEELRP
jgi:hypothetical protein